MALGKKTGGRKKGVPNKTTADVRTVIAAFATANAAKMDEKLNAIENPAEWMTAYLRAIEYHIPKLGRSEVTGKDGEPMRVSIVINGIEREQEREGMESTADAGPISRF